ncbi:MAG: hypothetical protein ACP5OR_02130 [Candidatus Dormibacteria bacterium]
MLIERATAEVHASRRQHCVDMVERTRLRRLVERVDKVIEECEEAHLQGLKEVNPEIEARATRIFTFAQKAIARTGNDEATQAVREVLARKHVKITDIMDILWEIQEIAFNVMLPWRSELPEDVDLLPSEGEGFYSDLMSALTVRIDRSYHPVS